MSEALPKTDTKEATAATQKPQEPQKPFWADFTNEKKNRLRTVMKRRIDELGEQEVEYELQASYTMAQIPVLEGYMKGLEEQRTENGKKLEAGKAKGSLALPKKERDEHKAYMEKLQQENKVLSGRITGATIQIQKTVQTAGQYVKQAETARDYREFITKQLQELDKPSGK